MVKLFLGNEENHRGFWGICSSILLGSVSSSATLWEMCSEGRMKMSKNWLVAVILTFAGLAPLPAKASVACLPVGAVELMYAAGFVVTSVPVLWSDVSELGLGLGVSTLNSDDLPVAYA